MGPSQDDIWDAIVRSAVPNNKSEDDEFVEAAESLYWQMKTLMEAGFNRDEAFKIVLTIMKGALG